MAAPDRLGQRRIQQRPSRLDQARNGSGFGDWFVMTAQGIEMHTNRFLNELPRFLDGIAAGDAARKVGYVRTVTTVVRSFDDR